MQTRVTADVKTAKRKIEQSRVNLITELVAGGLQTEDARSFLEAMPTPDELMPPVDIAAIEATTPAVKRWEL